MTLQLAIGGSDPVQNQMDRQSQTKISINRFKLQLAQPKREQLAAAALQGNNEYCQCGMKLKR